MLTFNEFVATGRFADPRDMDDLQIMEPMAIVYANGLWIGRGPMAKDARVEGIDYREGENVWSLVLHNCDWIDHDLRRLERILHEYYLRETQTGEPK